DPRGARASARSSGRGDRCRERRAEDVLRGRRQVSAPDLMKLGDFTATRRMLLLTAIAIAIGVIASYVALGLLKLIALFTNLFYFHSFSFASSSPADHLLGNAAVLVPIGGALVIGVMARYGSERIRGHGIPEALEAILVNGSRVSPKVAVLKPMSS